MAQPKIDLSSQVKGMLPVTNGGTGNNYGGSGGSGLPSQAGHAGKFLFSDGVNAMWMAFAYDLDGGNFNPPVSFGSGSNFDGGVY